MFSLNFVKDWKEGKKKTAVVKGGIIFTILGGTIAWGVKKFTSARDAAIDAALDVDNDSTSMPEMPADNSGFGGMTNEQKSEWKEKGVIQ